MASSHGRNHTQVDGSKVSMTPDVAEYYFSLLPREIRDYMLNESPILYNPQQVFGIYNQHGTAVTLEIIKQDIAKQTEKVYPGLRAMKKREQT